MRMARYPQTLEFARAQTSTLEWNTASDSTETADAERYRYAMKEAAGDPDSPTFEPGEKLVRCDVRAIRRCGLNSLCLFILRVWSTTRELMYLLKYNNSFCRSTYVYGEDSEEVRGA